MSPSLQFLVFTMAGWLNRQQQDLIDYLREENRILREQLGSGRRVPLIGPRSCGLAMVVVEESTDSLVPLNLGVRVR